MAVSYANVPVDLVYTTSYGMVILQTKTLTESKLILPKFM
jgi:hypothetical protein